ncbi:ABC transporter permease [Streptomyces sp. NPDC087903]|uniref:ABC transporter permease n=1 Tax=Streptomyces sp. NPDC087903 TaxID=3365819 RepID=UPI00381B147C
MSTLTSPAPAAVEHGSAAPRLTRWLLRLHRPALYLWTGLAVVLGAALLWLWGPLTDAAAAAWDQYDACRMAAACHYDQDAILRYKGVDQYTTTVLVALPFLVAAWAGGALTGRETENGTTRLAWTQGVSPARWLATKLSLPAALVTAGTGLLVLLHHLAWSAGDGRIDTAKPWSDVPTFYAGGPVLVALALAGLAIGALAGLVLRNSLGALVTGACATACLWAAAHLTMPYLWPTVTAVGDLRSGGAPGSGITVDTGVLTSTGEHLAVPRCGSSTVPECAALYDRLDAVGLYADYHPRSHYWPLQLMEAGIVLAVAAAAVTAAFVLLRRRTA